jgi:hypothetical protein
MDSELLTSLISTGASKIDFKSLKTCSTCQSSFYINATFKASPPVITGPMCAS